MEREIKFRGKRIDTGEWVEGDFIHGVGGKYGRSFILPLTHIYPKGCNELDGWEVDPETVIQFTGLKDKNDKEIYEEDIVKCDDIIVAVTWKDAAFHVITNESQGSSVFVQDRAKRFEVIGNIYENPELLK